MSLQGEAHDVNFMTISEGWHIYHRELKKEFDENYEKLLADLPKEKFYSLRGYLKGLKRAIELPDIIKARGQL